MTKTAQARKPSAWKYDRNISIAQDEGGYYHSSGGKELYDKRFAWVSEAKKYDDSGVLIAIAKKDKQYFYINVSTGERTGNETSSEPKWSREEGWYLV